jgi:hypothetical protein
MPWRLTLVARRLTLVPGMEAHSWSHGAHPGATEAHHRAVKAHLKPQWLTETHHRAVKAHPKQQWLTLEPWRFALGPWILTLTLEPWMLTKDTHPGTI